MNVLPNHYPEEQKRFRAQSAAVEAPKHPFLKATYQDRANIRAATAAKRAAWPEVRQPQGSLARFHKALLAHYGLRIIEAEPATVSRLRQLLRRAGVLGAEDAVGCSLARYLELNPGWALRHLIAAVLETYDLGVADAVLNRGDVEVGV